MKANPKGDWAIRDVEKLCKKLGLHCIPPASGSHYKVYSDCLEGTLTIPAHRPIKPVYIRNLTSYTDAHLKELEKRGTEK